MSEEKKVVKIRYGDNKKFALAIHSETGLKPIDFKMTGSDPSYWGGAMHQTAYMTSVFLNRFAEIQE